MISKLTIENFKAIGPKQEIPIRPITLLFGPNSGGKSSILHSLLLARHTATSSDFNAYYTDVGGKSLDLGGFKSYVYNRDINRSVSLGFHTAPSDHSLRRDEKGGGANLVARLYSRESSHEMNFQLEIGEFKFIEDPQKRTVFTVLSYRLLVNNMDVLRMSIRPDARLRLDSLNYDHPLVRERIEIAVKCFTTTNEISEKDTNVIISVLDKLVPQVSAECAGMSIKDVRIGDKSIDDRSGSSFFPISKGTREIDLADAVSFFFPEIMRTFLSDYQGILAYFLNRINYLGPLRTYPPRHIAFVRNEFKPTVAEGGYAWELLLSNRELREKVGVWLQNDKLTTNYSIYVYNFLPVEGIHEVLSSSISEMEVDLLPRDEIWQDYVKKLSVTGLRVGDGLPDGAVISVRERLNSLIVKHWILNHEMKCLELLLKGLNTKKITTKKLLDKMHHAFGNIGEKALFELINKIGPAADVVRGQFPKLLFAAMKSNARGVVEEYVKQIEAASTEKQTGEFIEFLKNERERILLEVDALPKIDGGDLRQILGPLFDYEPVISNPQSEASMLIAKILDSNLIREPDMMLFDHRSKTAVTLRDVGIGISQVIPVITYSYHFKDSILAIEQPELHLHPALQAELGDLFIESALGENKNTLIIETHSEHLILRILRRIRETALGKLPEEAIRIRPEDVSVVYVEPTSEGAKLHHLKINEEGDFIDKWPQGFFEERLGEFS